jgi:hypothetical protein
MNQRGAIAIAGLCLFAGVGIMLRQSQAATPRSVGPDIIVSDLFDLIYWGASGSIQAYSVGTYVCNIGDQPAVWQGSTNQHPVIGQNLFRLSAGRFEQIGQSWLKWAFLSENTDYCGTCIDPNSSSLLGVNCADPYEAAYSGYQGQLGPKSVVNPFTGEFPAVHPTPPFTVIGGRLQVHAADFGGSGTLYFAEGQYVTPDDSAAGNLHNNASYRQVWVLPNHNLTYISPQGTPSITVEQQPAIAAWAQQDASVFLASVDVPGDGRVYAACKATDLGGGTWHYEIAIQNLNSDRAVGGVLVPLPPGTSVSNLGFHCVEYHSGEVYDSTPWTGVVTAAGVRWDTVDYATNPNANALRWGTLYNFRFDAGASPPSVTLAELLLFKPGSPESIEVPLGSLPVAPGDTNCDGVVDFDDINPFVLALAGQAGYEAAFPGCNWLNADCNGDGQVNFDDINPFVACLSHGGCP